MPLKTITKIGSIGALAIFMVSPVFAGPQHDGSLSQPFTFEWPTRLSRTQPLLTPQGNVLSIGTVANGAILGDQLTFDVWNPELGTGANSHTTLINSGVDLRTYSLSRAAGSQLSTELNRTSRILPSENVTR